MNHSEAGTRSRPKIIILEDDRLYCKVLSYQLKASGYDAEAYQSYEELKQRLKNSSTVDLFILDYNLGEDQPTGLDICRKLKAYTNASIILLTGNDSLDTLVSCLNAGADHYIVKPCDIRELTARIDASLRNRIHSQNNFDKKLVLNIDENLYLEWNNAALINAEGLSVKLTDKEMGLLELILNSSNRTIERDRAFTALYGFEMDPMNRSVDVLISRLRKKISQLDSRYSIKNVRGTGYSLLKSAP